MTKLILSSVWLAELCYLKNLFGDREGDGSWMISTGNVNHINCILFSLFSG